MIVTCLAWGVKYNYCKAILPLSRAIFALGVRVVGDRSPIGLDLAPRLTESAWRLGWGGMERAME